MTKEEELADQRRRPREEPHKRSIAEQTLDALLRIEELLSDKPAPVVLPPVPERASMKEADAKPKPEKPAKRFGRR